MHMYIYLFLQGGIQPAHQPGEEPLIDRLGEGVPCIQGLFYGERRNQLLLPSLNGSVGQGMLQDVLRHLQQLKEGWGGGGGGGGGEEGRRGGVDGRYM